MRPPTRIARPTTHVVHPDPAHRPPPRHRAGGFFPLTDSPRTFGTPSPRSSNVLIRSDDSAPTLASPNAPAEANSPENASTTTTSGTEHHPKSDSSTSKVNGIGGSTRGRSSVGVLGDSLRAVMVMRGPSVSGGNERKEVLDLN